MKKILYITLAFPQQRVIKTINSLITTGHDVTILSMSLDKNKKNIFDIDQMKVINMDVNGKIKFLPIKHLIIKTKIKELYNEDFDFIICRDIFTFDLAQRLSRNGKVIVDIADNYPEVMSSYKKNRYLNYTLYKIFTFYEKVVAKKSYAIITVTQNSKRLLIEKHRIKSEKIITINNYPLSEDIIRNNDCPITKKFNKNLVYIGTVDEKVRDMKKFIAEIKGSNYSLDIYTFNYDFTLSLVNANDAHENVKVKLPLARRELINKLSKYDIGIIPHKLIEGTKYTIPNKLYDYIHAGIVTLSSNNEALKNEINQWNIGELYSKPENIICSLDEIEKNYKKYRSNIIEAQQYCLWEKDVNKLVEVLQK